MTRPCFLCRMIWGHDGSCIEGDPIAVLYAAVRQSGCAMTLYGRPVKSEEQLRRAALASGIARSAGGDPEAAALEELDR